MRIFVYIKSNTMETSIVTQNVREYKGDNNFILSLQNGLKKYGALTPKQLEAATNFFSKFTKEVKKESSEKQVNVNLKVSKFIAKRIANDNNLEFNPFLVTISKVLNETSKAYQVVGRMNTSDVTSCRCCGKDLTDWRSQATGVGPVCSKHLKIPYVKNQEDVAVFKKMLKLKIEDIGDLTFWVPKSQIIEGLDELSSQTSK
jgi:hypothetical protein